MIKTMDLVSTTLQHFKGLYSTQLITIGLNSTCSLDQLVLIILTTKEKKKFL